MKKDIIAYFFRKSCICQHKKINGQKIAVFIYESCAFWLVNIIDIYITNFDFLFIGNENTLCVVGLFEQMFIEQLHSFHLFFNFRISLYILCLEIFQVKIFSKFNSWHCCVEWTIIDSTFIRIINEDFLQCLSLRFVSSNSIAEGQGKLIPKICCVPSSLKWFFLFCYWYGEWVPRSVMLQQCTWIYPQQLTNFVISKANPYNLCYIRISNTGLYTVYESSCPINKPIILVFTFWVVGSYHHRSIFLKQNFCLKLACSC